jgi:hypothetical protein
LLFISLLVISLVLKNKEEFNTSPRLAEANVHFITFGNDTFKNARELIMKEADELKFFDTTTLYTDNSPELADFLKTHKDFILANKRGFGYWIWKFYIQLITMNKVSDGDIIVYADCGCSLNSKGVKRLKEYVNMARDKDLVAFQLPFDEYVWTKGDLLHELGCDEACYKTGQIMTTAFIYKNCGRMKDFFAKLLKIALKDNYKFVTDVQSVKPNLPGFSEHRHDQSIFSLGIKKILNSDIAVIKNEVDCSIMDFPINATRRRPDRYWEK